MTYQSDIDNLSSLREDIYRDPDGLEPSAALRKDRLKNVIASLRARVGNDDDHELNNIRYIIGQIERAFEKAIRDFDEDNDMGSRLSALSTATSRL